MLAHGQISLTLGRLKGMSETERFSDTQGDLRGTKRRKQPGFKKQILLVIPLHTDKAKKT